MVADQGEHYVGFQAIRQPDPPHRVSGQLRAGLVVQALLDPLAQVVQQQGQIEQFRPLHLAEQVCEAPVQRLGRRG